VIDLAFALDDEVAEVVGVGGVIFWLLPEPGLVQGLGLGVEGLGLTV